ncbi:MAG: hypothetical protein JXN59_16455 [Anaerolineae bacterium]|nr:hypothetical protein [Anaerolineae bacterium]
MPVDMQVLLGALGIFALRIVGISISTVRVLITVQGRRAVSSFLGFFEALVFALALGSVVNELDNVMNLMAYCLGFAVGTYVGMWLEEKFIVNYVTIQVVSLHNAHQIADAVREAGFGATEAWGQGAKGLVGSVRIVVLRRDVRRVVAYATEVDPDAFVTLDETRAVRHGWLTTPGRGRA